MTEQLFNEVTKWQDETFPNANSLSKLAHLKEEILELEKELQSGEDLGDIGLEFADCFLLLFGCASAAGINYLGICQLIEYKMEINKTRKWGEPDENGVVKHL